MANTTEVLLDGLAFPEGPRWHDGKLWFSDTPDGATLIVGETFDRCLTAFDIEADVPHAGLP